MKIEVTSNYGNYATKMSVELPDTSLSPLATELVRQGLFNINYRVAGSAVDKALGVDPKNGGRRGVDYSEDNSLKVMEAVEATIKKLKLPEGVSFEVTGQYEYGEGAGSAMVRATTLVDTFLGTSMEAGYRAILALPDGDRDALIAKAHEMGLGIQTSKAKK